MPISETPATCRNTTKLAEDFLNALTSRDAKGVAWLTPEIAASLSALNIEPHHLAALAVDPAYLDSAITEQGAAALLGAEVPTLRRWRQVGDGPPFLRIGRLVRYRRADLVSWMRSCRMRHGNVPLDGGE
ncbi:helix-turn-helix domain-containing protein [Fodinicurvata halophila]